MAQRPGLVRGTRPYLATIYGLYMVCRGDKNRVLGNWELPGTSQGVWVPCPPHSHPSSPTILSLSCAGCFHPHVHPTLPPPILPVLPLTLPTLCSPGFVFLLAPVTARFREQRRPHAQPSVRLPASPVTRSTFMFASPVILRMCV